MRLVFRQSLHASLLTFPLLATSGGGQASAATFSTLYSFGSGGRMDAASPYDGPVRDGAGNLYGTTFSGGAGSVGAVYEVTPPAPGQTEWTETVIHSFSYPRGTNDGAQPQGKLVLGSGGVLYGNTAGGGGAGNEGGGTVFSLTPPAKAGAAWKEKVLTVLPAPNGVPARPFGSMVQDSTGALYGVTSAGGQGTGILYTLTPPAAGETAWKRTTLHVFPSSGESGQQPSSGLIADANGALYGSTIGTSAASLHAGTVYKLTPPTGSNPNWTFATLYGFPADGSRGLGIGEIELDASGAIYGVAAFGGGKSSGVAFRLNPPSGGQMVWTSTVIRTFPGADFGMPEGGLTANGTGVLLGTTAGSTNKVGGAIYELTSPANPEKIWSVQTLQQLIKAPSNEGSYPVGAMVPDGSGNFFGVTENGGPGGGGIVYEITP